MQNNLIYPVSQGEFYGAINEYDIVFIGYKSPRNYTSKHRKPMRRKKITCVFETCISTMLLQSDLNKWRLT